MNTGYLSIYVLFNFFLSKSDSFQCTDLWLNVFPNIEHNFSIREHLLKFLINHLTTMVVKRFSNATFNYAGKKRKGLFKLKKS